MKDNGKNRNQKWILPLFVFLASFQMSIESIAQNKYYVTTIGSGLKDGSSWSNSASDLGRVIDVADKNDTVWLAAGTYEGGFFLKDGVSIFGGFAGTEQNVSERKLPATGENLTILDGKLQYRVLTQQADFTVPTIYDGLIIQNGSAVDGGGVRLMANGILRLCIIRNNVTGYPSVGDYVAEQGGVIFKTDNAGKKAWVVAPEVSGRTYYIGVDGVKQVDQLSSAITDMQGSANSATLARRKARAMEAIASYRSSVNNKLTDWYIPSAGEWFSFLSDDNQGKNETFYLVNNTLVKNGFQALDGDSYWSSTTAKQYGLWASWYADFENGHLNKLNVYQYNKIRGVRSFDMAIANGKGGAIFALAGSKIEGCLILGNTASLGSAICARGNVVIVNTTVVDNVLTSGRTSNAVDGNSDVKVYNTIVTNNTVAGGASANYDSKIVYQNSAIETSASIGGTGNIALTSDNAGFVDPLIQDYRLSESSICSGVGSLQLLATGLIQDLAGKARPEKGKVSIGAFEPYILSSIESEVEGIKVYPTLVKSGEKINVELNIAKDFDFEIYSMLGKIIDSGDAETSSIIAPQTEGVYILKLRIGDENSQDFRIVVKN